MTHRTRLLLAACVALAATFLPGAAWAQTPQLNAVVGPGFTIFLRNADGTNVTHLPAGTYDIVVDDRSIEHNFHLMGTGVDMLTQVEEVGVVTWTVNLVDGIYNFQCDPHSATMNGRFAVGTAQLPPPPPPPARRKTVVATVGPGLSITLTMNGRRVRTLTAGPYMVMVRDRSKKQNFHLTGPGVNRKSGVAFSGMQHWNVRFQKGKTYRFFSDARRTKLKGSFRVT